MISSNIVGSWSNPEKLRLTAVLPPTSVSYIPRSSRFRRYLDEDGNALVVEAVSVGFSWQPPPPSSAFTLTGYDGLLFNASVAGYEGVAQSQIRMFDEVCKVKSMQTFSILV